MNHELEGTEVPSLIIKIVDSSSLKKSIEKIIEREDTELFLLDVEMSSSRIKVEVDSEVGVSLKRCVNLSKLIEQQLGEAIDTFTFEVTSPDITKPLRDKRQYVKNINKIMKINTLHGEKLEGILKETSSDEITLEYSFREAKPVGKGKRTVTKTHKIPYTEIKEARVGIKFN